MDFSLLQCAGFVIMGYVVAVFGTLVGAGGGIFFVPIFLYFFGWEPTLVIGTSLTVVMSTKDEDVVNHLLFTSSLNTVLFFTNLGRVYRLKAYEIPEANTRNSKGVAAINVLPLSNNEKVNALIDLDQVEPTMQ